MDISAHAFSLADRPRMGHLGHQCSHAPVRPILHLVSSSRRPRRETGCRGYVIDRSLLVHVHNLHGRTRPKTTTTWTAVSGSGLRIVGTRPTMVHQPTDQRGSAA